MWIRVVCAFDSDPRVLQLSVVGRAMLQYLWRRLMERDGGVLPCDFFEPGYLSSALGSPPVDLHEVAQQGTLILKLGLFKVVDGGYEASNWEKYQWAYDADRGGALVTGEDAPKVDMETPDQRAKRKARERARAYRQRKGPTVTQRDADRDASVTPTVTQRDADRDASVTPTVTQRDASVTPTVTQRDASTEKRDDVCLNRDADITISSCSNNRDLSGERQILEHEERIGGGMGEGRRGTPTPSSAPRHAPRHASEPRGFGQASALVPTEVKGQLALMGDGMPEPDPTLVEADPKMVVGLEDGETVADAAGGLDRLRRETEKYPDEIRRLVVFMLEHMESEKPDFKRPTLAALVGWHRDMNLLVNRDGKSPRDVARVIKWATHDPFWSANIRSPNKLREQFDRLEMQMGRPLAGPVPRNSRPPEPAAPPVRDLEAHMRQLGIIGGPK